MHFSGLSRASFDNVATATSSSHYAVFRMDISLHIIRLSSLYAATRSCAEHRTPVSLSGVKIRRRILPETTASATLLRIFSANRS